MKALSIIALVFAGISIFVPVMGVFLAMLCSVLALIAFKKSPTLSGITFGINIISTAFLSPSLMVAASTSEMAESGTGVGLYWFYVGFHVVLFVIAIVYAMMTKKKAKAAQA